MQLPLFTLVFGGFPENIAVALLGFTISKAQYTSWKTVVYTGIVLALTAYFIRMIPNITFGVHTLIQIAVLFLALIKFGKVEIANGILGSVIGFLALVVFETIGVMSIMKIFNLTSADIVANTYARTLAGWPHILLLFLSSFLIKKWRLRGHNNAFFSN